MNRRLRRFSLSCLQAPRRTCWICDDDVFEMWRKAVRYVTKEKSRSSAHFYPGGFARLEFIFLRDVRMCTCMYVWMVHMCVSAQTPAAAGYDIYSACVIHIFPYINFIEVKVDACLVVDDRMTTHFWKKILLRLLCLHICDNSR